MKLLVLTITTSLFFQAGAYASEDSLTQTIATGMFMSVGTKTTAGDLAIEKRSDGLYLTLAPNFKTQEGPDLRIVLRDSSGHHQMMVLDSLKSFEGMEEYKLLLSADEIMNFNQVVIYCAKFHVDFGVATLD